MTANKKDDGELTLKWLTKSCTTMFTRVLDFQRFQSARIRALEDRLAQLDGRDDAKAACRAALSSVNVDHLAAGRKPACFELHETDSGMRHRWTNE